MDAVSIAFIPLNDAAPLIVARAKGFAKTEGIDLQLHCELTWSRLASRLLTGDVDAAHMLAPLAIATSVGLNDPPVPLAAPIKLNINGNSLVASPALAAALNSDHQARLAHPLQTARAFADAIRARDERVILGVVHRCSSHALLLRHFLASAGLDPDADVTLTEVGPSRTADAMRSGEIHGFLAGEPWGSVAILEGLAELVTTTASLWRRGVEKVLALRARWMAENGELTDRLVRAIDRAAAWCDEPENRGELARLLEHADHLAQPAEFLVTALSGRLPAARGAPPVFVPDYVLFHRDRVGLPSPRQAQWAFDELARWKMVPDAPRCRDQAAAVFRPDIYCRATGCEPATGTTEDVCMFDRQ